MKDTLDRDSASALTPLHAIPWDAYLRERLQRPLPGTDAHLTMAPEYRLDPAFLTVGGKSCREAAVLVLLVPLEETPTVVLTLRPTHLPNHPGQISFPGGSREGDESLLETALREAREEIGLEEPVEILGALSPIFIPHSGFCVYPFVARASRPPAFKTHEAEVEVLLHVPLSLLLDPATRKREHREVRGTITWIPFYSVSGYEIWGATAMILAELLALFQED